VAASREGSLLGRVTRDLQGRRLDATIRLQAEYSPQSVERFVRRVAEKVAKPPRSATVTANAVALRVVPAHAGIAVRRGQLARLLRQRLVDPHASRTLEVPTKVVEPAVTTTELPRKYPSFITVSRETYTLRLFRGLKLAKTYRIAVGRAGLETPAGLYRIYDKQINPWWHVPKSAWAGDLAGRVIPPGPDDPIKSRWMGFWDGAGIHGTDETSSIGSAASHGCIRMMIPDVEQLYDLVPLHTPIYVG
jgi:lipoprotein-anchoring transpeptidase ErfK/SrfK